MTYEKMQYELQPRLIQMMLDVRQADKQIERLNDTIRQIEAQMRKCTSWLTGMPRSGQKITWDDLINRKDELISEVQKIKMERLELAQRVAISPECDKLDMDEYRVLCLRYMDERSFNDIAKVMHMGKTTVYELERRAYAKIRTNPNESERIRTI